MEYSSSFKNNDIMEFAGKLIELEKVIMHNVTQKDKHGMQLLIIGYWL